jgi:ubiquinone biosynthesis accessory factor UbiJ
MAAGGNPAIGMKIPDPRDAPARMANRILDEEVWAREKLEPFAGRVFTLSVGPLSTRFLIAGDGRLETAAPSASSDLDLVLAPLSVPSFLANPSRWNEFVREEGDAELGGALKELARTLPWFVEAALAKALGPMVGQRVADSGRRLLGFPEYAAQRVTESVASYARDEAGLLVRSEEMRPLREGIGIAAARIDALEQRFDALSVRAASAKPQSL